jgi:arginine deiminase
VQDNIHKLKEEKIGLEKRNEMIPNLSKQLAEKTVKCELLEKEKMHWQSFLEQNKIEPEIQSPYDMIKLLSQKNNQIAELKDLVGQARANEVKSQLFIQDCTDKSDKLREAFDKLEQTNSKLEKEKLSLIRKANLADKQCYLLKEQIVFVAYLEKLRI